MGGSWVCASWTRRVIAAAPGPSSPTHPCVAGTVGHTIAGGGTCVAALEARDPVSGRDTMWVLVTGSPGGAPCGVDRGLVAVQRIADAETAIQGPAETCPTCRIAFIVPATIAAARAGDLKRARHYAQACETALEIVALPPAWHASVAEARGWLARAEGREDDARGHFGEAAEGFATWSQPLDAARCAALVDR